jgi:hypothetical protein
MNDLLKSLKALETEVAEWKEHIRKDKSSMTKDRLDRWHAGVQFDVERAMGRIARQFDELKQSLKQ